MNWERLLSEKRVKEVFDDVKSKKVAGDFRSEFERDYDRAVFSTPVRRLQDKTQVFLLEPHDAVRTRLTHSLEVSTVAGDIAHTVARYLVKRGVKNGGLTEDQARQVEVIAATCGLIHDLGNPPFGHAGERAISNWFEKRREHDADFLDFDDMAGKLRKEQMTNDFLHFEGNAQTLRLVSRLQVLADLRGLNLTFGTLSAACKYTSASDQRDEKIHERSKPGFFTSENALIEAVRERNRYGCNAKPHYILTTVDSRQRSHYPVAMKAVEFETELSGKQDLHIPREAAAQLPEAGKARVIVLVEEDGEDAQWRKAAYEFHEREFA